MKCPYDGSHCNKPKIIEVTSKAGDLIKVSECCDQCPLINIISNLASLLEMENNRCSCGLSFSNILQGERMGCPACYTKFAEELKQILPRMHGGGFCHKGKSLSLHSLKKKMTEAVSQEKYEEAAVLRDKIRQSKKRFQGDDLKTPDQNI